MAKHSISRQAFTVDQSLVFVFGTLKEGFPNFAINRGVRVPGTFRTRAAYPLYLAGDRHSPWLIDMPHTGARVTGQVFQVDAPVLVAMDKLERVSEPDGYCRRILELEHLESSAVVNAFAYLKPREQLVPADIRKGPLEEYDYEHAALYRPLA